jgi:hypothetical protein
MSRAGPFNVKGAAGASKFLPRSAGRGILNNSSTSESKGFTAPSEKNKPTNSSTTSVGSNGKSNGIHFFKCEGRGHVIRECPNNRTIIVNDRGEYESTCEEEIEVDDKDKFQDADEEAHTYC